MPGRGVAFGGLGVEADHEPVVGEVILGEVDLLDLQVPGDGLVAALLNRRRILPTSPDDPAHISQLERLTRDNTKLRRDNHELAEHLELAVANIQRLTVDNHQLRHQLEAATNVTHIGTR